MEVETQIEFNVKLLCKFSYRTFSYFPNFLVKLDLARRGTKIFCFVILPIYIKSHFTLLFFQMFRIFLLPAVAVLSIGQPIESGELDHWLVVVQTPGKTTSYGTATKRSITQRLRHNT